MKTFLFDTRLPRASLDSFLKNPFAQAFGLTLLGAGDAGTEVYSITFTDEGDRERFRDAVRNLEVELGLRKSVPPRTRGRMSDLVDSFARSPGRALLSGPARSLRAGPIAANQRSAGRGPGAYSYSQKPKHLLRP